MKERHTSTYLKSMIVNVMSKYDIPSKQVYSVKTDNRANLAKAVRCMIEDQEKEIAEVNSLHEDFLLDDKVTESEDPDVQLDGHFDILDYDGATLEGIRCAAYMLQLDVGDALKEKSVSSMLSKARDICKRLRCPTTMMMLKRLKLKKRLLNVPTRWHSTHDMLKRLFKLRSFCEELSSTNKNLMMNPREWDRITVVAVALKPPRDTMKLLRLEELNLGDFFGTWLRCHI